MAEFTKEDNVEIQILRAIQEVLKFTDPNSIKASIILDRIRTILGLKDLSATPDMYKALKAFDEYLSTNFPANIRLKQIATERMEQALAKAEGKD